MSFSAEFKAAVLKYIGAPEGAVFETWNEATEEGGYCSSCYYEYTEVVVTYRVDGAVKYYTYNGKFSEMLEDLLRASD